MSEWKEKVLAQICKIKGGKRLPAGQEFAEGVTSFPYLRVTDMVNGTIDSTSLVYVKPEIEPYIKNYKISKDDLYITIAGTLGLFGSIPDHLDKAQLTENAAKLCEIDCNEFNKDYLKYYFNSEYIQSQIKREIGVGGGVPKLALFRIEKLLVKYPEKRIQNRIAKILITTDSAIENTQATIVKYKAIKQGMLHDLFTRGIELTTGKLRLKYEDAPELYKESKLGIVPRDWEENEFNKICDFITDGSHFSPTPIEEGEIIANVKDMGEFRFDYETCTRISQNEFAILKSQNCCPKKGDVLLSKDGTIGRVILFNDSKEIVLLSSIAIIRPSLHLLSEFLYSFLKSEHFDKQLIIKTSGSALKRIVLKDINTLIIVYPTDLMEQKFISDRLLQIEKKLQLELTYLSKLQMLKQGLMGDLLGGRRSVKINET